MIRALFFLTALAAATPAVASDASDIVTTVNAYNDAVNKNDLPGAAGYYAPAASIIDEFTPHIWMGAKAFEQWGADYGAFATAQKMTDPIVTLGKPRHVMVEGDRAYAIFPATFKFKRAGKPVAEPSLWTFALQKIDGKWKIAAWSWALK
jgi:ketosteroid isomerase-like protein